MLKQLAIPSDRPPDPADAEPFWHTRRRRTDALLAVIAFAVLAAAAAAAHIGQPTVVEVNLFRLINQLPEPLTAPLVGTMQLGALAAVPVIALIALIAGRHRLAALIVTTGLGAWSVAKLVQYLVDEEPARVRISQVLLHGTVAQRPGLAFPASHEAIAAALAVVAAPYLGRQARRVTWLLTLVIGIARVYIGLHLPIDVIGGAALGVLVGSLVSLVAGVPDPTLKESQLRVLLGRMGVTLGGIDGAAGRGDLRCRTEDGTLLLVETLTADRDEQGWLARLWRLAAYRQPYRSHAAATPAHRADRQGHVLLLAHRAGVRVPALVGTTDLGREMSVVVRHWVDGRPLAAVPPGEVTEPIVADAWAQLRALHGAGIAHRELSLDHVIVGDDGLVRFAGWGEAYVGADRSARAADVADLAVTLASWAGAVQAVRAAIEILGPAVVDDAMAHLQPVTLSAAARQTAAHQPALVPSLREQVAEQRGRPVEHPASPARVAIGNLGPVAAVAAAVLILLPRLAKSSTSWSTLAGADWPWLAGVVAGVALSYCMAAAALVAASGAPLGLRRTTAVQLAATCTNRVLPAGLGAVATNIRYLELAGFERADATTTVAVTATSGFVVHAIGTAAAVALLRGRAAVLHVPDLDTEWRSLVALGVIAGAVGWLLSARRVRRALPGWIRIAAANVGRLARDPKRAAWLLGASAGISFGYIVALACALAAFGSRPGLGSVAGVYLASSAVAAVAPTPGGVGPFEAAAVASLGALGVGAGPAVAGVITYRLLTYWLPVAPGAVALRELRRRQVL